MLSQGAWIIINAYIVSNMHNPKSSNRTSPKMPNTKEERKWRLMIAIEKEKLVTKWDLNRYYGNDY